MPRAGCREGWQILECYTDAAISGASLMRPGIQQLMQDAMAGRFEIILAEALDRLSRNLADIAGLYQRLTFAGVRFITLSEGEITDLHIGLKGTMNSLQLKDLAEKVRRGLRGRVEAGKSGEGTASATMWCAASMPLANRSGASVSSIRRRPELSGASSMNSPAAIRLGRSPAG